MVKKYSKKPKEMVYAATPKAKKPITGQFRKAVEAIEVLSQAMRCSLGDAADIFEGMMAVMSDAAPQDDELDASDYDSGDVKH